MSDYHPQPYWEFWVSMTAPPAADTAEVQRKAEALRHKIARLGWDLKRLDAQEQRRERRRQRRVWR